MDKLFGDLKTFFKPPKCTVDNFVFRMHYKFTLTVLIAFSIAVTGSQFVGNPIECISKDDIPENLLKTFCWISTTFSIKSAWRKEVGKVVVYPGVDKYTEGEERVYHAYYQWVCFVLFLQGLLFYVPRYLWKNTEGYKIKNLTMNFNSPVVSALEEEKKEEKVLVLVQQPQMTNNDFTMDEKEKKMDEKEKKMDEEGEQSDEEGSQKDEKPKKMVLTDDAKLLVDYLFENRGHHTFYGSMFVVCEILNFVNVLGQIYLMDTFLGGEFTTYGTEVLAFTEWDYTVRYDPMIKVFPRMSKCTFYRYGSSGDVQKHDALCLISINILNEKIYIFLWFWFVILATLSGLALLYRMAIALIPRFRYFVLYSKCRRANPDDLKIVLRKYDRDDWLVLSLLCKNMRSGNFTVVLRELAKKIVLEDMKTE